MTQLLLIAALAAPGIGMLFLDGQVNGHRYEVRILRETATRTRHRKVDGRGWTSWGWGDGARPTNQIGTFRVRIDGHAVRLPERAFLDCFDAAYPNSAEAWLTQNGRRLRVKVYGAISLYSYTAVWDVSPSGGWTRWIYEDDEVPAERRTVRQIWTWSENRGWISR